MLLSIHLERDILNEKDDPKLIHSTRCAKQSSWLSFKVPTNIFTCLQHALLLLSLFPKLRKGRCRFGERPPTLFRFTDNGSHQIFLLQVFKAVEGVVKKSLVLSD